MRELWIENEAVSSRLTALGRLQPVVAGRKRPEADDHKRLLSTISDVRIAIAMGRDQNGEMVDGQ